MCSEREVGKDGVGIGYEWALASERGVGRNGVGMGVW